MWFHVGQSVLHSTHQLAEHRGFVFCLKCGYYTTIAMDKASCPRKLNKNCRPGEGKNAGQQYLRRLLQGKPPRPGLTWPQLHYIHPGSRRG